ncbi:MULTISPECIES: spermidine synthase family protein [Streptomyces]|uniref:Spermidine synthase n=2 Tax=Streptomyces fradiae TaxID=1906 RepID=A0ABQ6XRL8_STRFR|nr:MULTISPECIES: spermidine synthase [Streptomyces]KAF0648378.1 spermidine synthase [Streptomyces fradiae ATCC 10745 = DSM 40063]QEV14070.1 spermidine synthase [Streptomyces fradiae ATCC 10745 = DSM 40063]
MPVTLDRREGPYGEVVLRRRDDHFEIIANGTFLMDTSDGRSERLLVDAALQALRASRPARAADAPARPGALARAADAPDRPSVLIGGLGVGFSLAHAAADPAWGRIVVVEREQAIIDWHREGPLAALSASALADPRTVLVHADLVAHLHDPRVPDTYDALCLDIDNGPDWTVTEGNDGLYAPSGLAACARRLNPGGVLAVWSARPSRDFEASLRNAGFHGVRTEEIPVARGVPDVVHLAVRPA